MLKMSITGMFREFSTELVKEVKKRPCLYDKNADGYKDHSVVNLAWTEVGEKLCIDHDLAKKRWQNLRSSYVRSRSANTEFYLGPHMKFLDPHLLNIVPKSHLNSVVNSGTHVSEPDPQEEEQSDSDTSIPLMSPPHCSPSPSPHSLSYSNNVMDREDLEQPPRKRIKPGNSFESEDWQGAAKAFFLSQLKTPTSSGYSNKASTSGSSEPSRNPDLDFLKGLLPQIEQLQKRNKRLYFQKISNLLFTMLDEQDDAHHDELIEEREAKPAI